MEIEKSHLNNDSDKYPSMPNINYLISATNSSGEKRAVKESSFEEYEKNNEERHILSLDLASLFISPDEDSITIFLQSLEPKFPEWKLNVVVI